MLHKLFILRTVIDESERSLEGNLKYQKDRSF